MAKILAFSIYDSKAEYFGTPFFFPAPGQAIRAFTDLCQDPQHPVGKHPSDYGLFRIGEFDDSNGALSAAVAATIIVSGLECVGGELRVERA